MISVRLLAFLLAAVVSAYIASPAHAAVAKPDFKVVIDPGHGGSDTGAVFRRGFSKFSEKDITLSIAKLVASQLRDKGMRVVLTRSGDSEVALPARTALANKLSADIFLSIHMNSSTESGSGEGIETYILNHATDASSRRLAQLENSVLGPNPRNTPEDTDVALILKDLRLDANLYESKRLACTIQNNLVSNTASSGIASRGVKQALFHVLLGADMPSVLVETGFINSSRDRSFVLSARGQRTISAAIAGAVSDFRSRKNSPESSSLLSRCKVN